MTRVPIRLTVRGSWVLLLGWLALAGVGPVRAQGLSDRVTFHGFAGWSYGRTNRNIFLTGQPDGDYRQGQFSLNVAASLSDQLHIIAQPSFSQGREEGASAISLDYAFAQWRFNDALQLRLGKVQQPFGIYTEILKVGTLRPFFSLPQSIYGPSGLATDGLTGISLSAATPAGKPWGLSADLYGGGIDLSEFIAPVDINRGDTLGTPVDIEHEINRDVIGFRTILQTPVSGLSVGGSAFTGVAEEAGIKNRNTVFGFQAEYLSDVWSIRAEYAHDAEGQKYIINSGYVEAAYRLTSKWQVAARYDRFTNTLPGYPSPQFPALLRHRDWTGGLAYWFSPNLVLKAAYHDVDGNRFAGPDVVDILADANAGTLNPHTHLFEVGAQFSF